MTIELAKAKQILVSKIGDMLVDGDLQSFLSDVLSALSLKLEDAPSDGKQYSREDGSWSEVVIPTPDVTEAPTDGKQYARKNSNWSEVVLPAAGVPEAPADGKQYARKNSNWAEVVIPASGVPEAPIDGKQYARKDAAWAEVEGGGGEEIPILTYAQCTTFSNLINALKVYGPHGPERFYAPTTFLGIATSSSEGETLFTRVGTMDPEIEYGTFYAVYSRLGISRTDEITDSILLSDGYGAPASYSRRLFKKDDTIIGKTSGFYLTNYNHTTNKVSRKLVTVDTNGFVKESSPIINLSSVGISTNSDPVVDQAVFTQLSTGVYEICNVPLLSRDGWYIETPKDRNNNVYFTLDYEEYPDESKLIIRTYEPDYSSGRAENGAPMDIIEGRFVALRFEGNEEE